MSLRTLGKGGVGGNPAGRQKRAEAQRAADVSRRGPKPRNNCGFRTFSYIVAKMAQDGFKMGSRWL